MKKRYLLPGLLALLLVVALGVFAAACGGTTTTITAAQTTTTAAQTTTTAAQTTTTAAAALSDYYVQSALLTGPNVPLLPDWHYDEPLFDPASGQVYLADSSNFGVDVWDNSGQYVGLVGGQGTFAGPAGADHFDFSEVGPNGLALDGQGLLWAGDGDGSVKVIDTKTLKVTQTIVTGATKKADTFAFDSTDGLMMVVCPEEEVPAPATPFVAFIDAKTYKVVGTLKLPDAAVIGQPVWNETTGKFYLCTGTKTTGEVDVIDPVTRTLENKIDLGQCQPAGEAFGPGTQLLVGTAATDWMDAGSPAVIDVATGKILARLDAYTPLAGGITMMAYDSGAQRYLLANTAGIGVIDANALTGLPDINVGSRVVAVDSATQTVFVPLDGKGVGVYVPGP
jgi:YVTN family beta-propeller protein